MYNVNFQRIPDGVRCTAESAVSKCVHGEWQLACISHKTVTGTCGHRHHHHHYDHLFICPSKQ